VSAWKTSWDPKTDGADSGASTRRPGPRPIATPAPAPIKIGVLDDITGVTTIEGAPMRGRPDLVVQQHQLDGRHHCHPIQVLYVDLSSERNPEQPPQGE
jgi:hypothetical protein